jgi:hypothetical protein
VPRPEDDGWGDFTLLPRADPLPEPDRPRSCTCWLYPCTEADCLRSSFSDTDRCAACAKHGRALFTRAEVRWVDTGQGLPAAEVEALRQLWGTHEGHNSRLIREGLPKYGTGGDPPEPVTAACA